MIASRRRRLRGHATVAGGVSLDAVFAYFTAVRERLEPFPYGGP
jgi:hypothetical protein